MKLCTLIIAIFLPAAVAAQQSPSRGVDTRIRRLEERWRVAQLANDTATLRQLLAPEATFIGTSGSLRDRSGFIASRSTSQLPHETQFSVDELRLRGYGTTVIVTGRESSTRFSARFTHVWARRGDTWSLIAVQRTDIAPP